MKQGRTAKKVVAQDWLRHNISLRLDGTLRCEAADACLMTRKGLPRGTYVLRLSIETADGSNVIATNKTSISLEPVGGGGATIRTFHVPTDRQHGCLTLPLYLNQRSRIRIHPGQIDGCFRATWSVLASSPEATLQLLRQWTTGEPLGTAKDVAVGVKEEIKQRSEQLLRGRNWKHNSWTQKRLPEANDPAVDHDYVTYLTSIEPELRHSSEDIKQWIDLNPDAPRISILIPTYNTNADHLKQCLDSIMRQSYPHWELCICDDCSNHPHVRVILEEYRQCDPRIRLTFRTKNGHICQSSNDALALATGSFMALVDHDDVLNDDALYWVARELQKRPTANLIYSDEDKIDDEGNRSSPHFKPAFNIDLLLAYNFISHLGVYRTELVKQIGGFRHGLEGSQDHDLALRVIQESSRDQIIHIPRVLYHWRMHAGSTAVNPGSKDYTSERGLRAVQDFLDRQHQQGGVAAKAINVAPNRFRCQWQLPEHQPSVELIIPTRDKADILELAIQSILDTTAYSNYQITIVDNQSIEDETQKLFDRLRQSYPDKVRIRPYNKPFNYSAINNYAVDLSSSDIVGLVNNDVEAIEANWLSEMVSHCIRPDVGCVGAKLLYSNDTIQHGGVIVGIGEVAGHAHKYAPRSSPGYVDRLQYTQQMSAVTAACLLVRRNIYMEAGGLNERDLRIAFNDVDFCLRVHSRGYRNIFTPNAILYHHESISRGSEDTPEKQQRFLKEVNFMLSQYDVLNKGKLPSDLFYNPNLTSTQENFSTNQDADSVKNGLREHERPIIQTNFYNKSQSINSRKIQIRKFMQPNFIHVIQDTM